MIFNMFDGLLSQAAHVSPAIQSIIGIVTILGISIGFSENRSSINWPLIIKLLGFTFLLAYGLLSSSVGLSIIEKIASFFALLYQSADDGISFLFGSLANPSGSWGFIFSFRILPMIVFFSALISFFQYLGLIRGLISILGTLFRPILSATPVEIVICTANSFLGQGEIPILLQSQLKSLSQPQMFVLLVAGMSTINGALIAIFSSMGIMTKHLLISSIMSIFTSLLISKIWFPDNKNDKTKEPVNPNTINSTQGALDAIATGTFSGLTIALNIGAMLLVIISLLAFFDKILLTLSSLISNGASWILSKDISYTITLSSIFGFIGKPFAWLIGIPISEITTAGKLIGTKVAVNEMIAYCSTLKETLSTRTSSILSYALCGFSNFSSIGIMIGAVGAIAPEQTPFISRFGVRAVFAAVCVNLLNAAIVALII